MSFQLQNISLMMGAKTLLSNVDLTLNPGELLAVLGPNGAGKSSLLKIMAGEYRHHSGAMDINKQRFENYDAKERAKILAVLPQTSSLAFPFSVFEVVMLGRLPHSSGARRDREIVYAALAQTDVSHLANALYPTLSGGEKQRVQLARVLCQIWESSKEGKSYLLLDEPTSALDLSHQHHTLALAKDMAEKGVAVLSILHDVNLAAQYADKILMLEEGRAIAYGNVEEILTAPRISSLYGIEVAVIDHPKGSHPLVVTL